jgi:gluconolactonase
MMMLTGGRAANRAAAGRGRGRRYGFAAIAACALLIGAAAARAEDPGFPAPTGDPSVLPQGAKLDRVFDGGCVLTEGPAVSPTDGAVYFTDITFTALCKDPSGKYPEAGVIWKYDPKSGQTTVFRSPSGMANGMKFDADGNLIVAQGADWGLRSVVKIDMKTGKSYILAGMFDGKPLNAPNGVSIDNKGRIYFTDPRYLGWEPIYQPVEAVYRIDPDGKVTRIITDVPKPNAVQVSPDQKTLYVSALDDGNFDFTQLKGAKTQNGMMALFAFDLAPDGKVSNRRTVVNWSPNDGADDITVDTDGNIYAAVRDVKAPGVYIYSPQGKQLAYISTGKELPTNLDFGYGDDGNLLYVTSGKSLYRIRLAKKGWHIAQAH